jgi:hypothetical protein
MSLLHEKVVIKEAAAAAKIILRMFPIIIVLLLFCAKITKLSAFKHNIYARFKEFNA